MAQPEQAAGGATDDTVIAAEPTIEDRFAAIMDTPPEEEEVPGESPDAEADQAAEAEAQAEDEPELEAPEVETDDLPPIPPPVSWTAEEKAEFAELPRNVQETLTRREAEREKFVQSKAAEVKTARSEVEQAAVAVLQQANNAHVQQLMALLPQIPDEPSAYLQMQDPNQYAYLKDSRALALAQHAHVQQVIETVNQQNQQMQEMQLADARKEFQETINNNLPEWFDPIKGPELQKNLSSTALELGYSADNLPKATATDILAIKKASEWKAKADKFDTLMAKQMEKVREAKALPKVSRPGTVQPKGTAEGQRYAADRDAMRSGDKDATNRVFARFV